MEATEHHAAEALTRNTTLWCADDRHSNWAREFKALGLDPVLLGHTSTPVDPRTVHPNDPLLQQSHAGMNGFNTLLKSDLHDTTPKAWASWLELTHGYTHPGVTELYGGYSNTSDTGGARASLPAATACRSAVALPSLLAVGGNWLSRSQLKEDGSAFYDSEHCDSAFMVLKSKEYIRGRQLMDVPWSLHLSLWRPHPPWVCSAPYHEMHDPDHVSPFVRAADPATEAAVHPWLGWNTDTTLPASTMGGDDGLLRHMRSQYLGSVSEVDYHMGSLFDWLKATGEWDRTMIVVTADHGEQLGDHWQLGKLGFFRQSREIPLIIRDPRPSADGGRGQRVEACTEHIDIAPTLIEAMGGVVPPVSSLCNCAKLSRFWLQRL